METTRKPKRQTEVKTANSGLMNKKKDYNYYGGRDSFGKHISDGWHTVEKDIDDVEKYIFDYMAGHKYDVIKVMIGTDSALKTIRKGEKEVKLLTVICLRRMGTGTHVIKRRESVKFNRWVSTGEKLNIEVNKTYELAQYLMSLSLTFEVHLDLNPDENFESFNVYKHVHGWFESMGLETSYKPVCAAAMACADFYL